jgi:membrane peptidoglycan carboxypeptidase
MAITKVVLPNGKVDKRWGEPRARRALSEAVAWKVNDVLQQNAMYGTGSGSGDGVHPAAGKTGTTEDHADAWYVGYTRNLSTAVWMGYPRGEIPMVSVHGQTVAGSTFAVPIWHLYMRAALWRAPVREFVQPEQEIAYRPLEKHYYGYTYNPYSSSSSSSSDDEEEAEEEDSAQPPPPPPARPAEATPKPEPSSPRVQPPPPPAAAPPARRPAN